MAEQMRALGYLCPECGKIVYGERTRFAMSAAAVGLVCGCGRSELTAQPEGASCRLTVPCGLCGGEHRAEAAAERLLEGEGIGLACPKTRQLTVEKSGEDGAFVDSVIMYEVLSELRDIAARGGVSCACGASGCAMEIQGAAVDLVCRQCGARLRLPAATDEDLDRLCCQYTLTIPGRK